MSYCCSSARSLHPLTNTYSTLATSVLTTFAVSLARDVPVPPAVVASCARWQQSYNCRATLNTITVLHARPPHAVAVLVLELCPAAGCPQCIKRSKVSVVSVLCRQLCSIYASCCCAHIVAWPSAAHCSTWPRTACLSTMRMQGVRCGMLMVMCAHLKNALPVHQVEVLWVQSLEASRQP